MPARRSGACVGPIWSAAAKWRIRWRCSRRWPRTIPTRFAPCAVTKLIQAAVAELEAEFCPTLDLPRGPEGKVIRSDARPNDFMWDDELGEVIEFESAALSLYGRNTM